jgi:uncharacterized BrkB/YihY/UPF0761 family membrane protein
MLMTIVVVMVVMVSVAAFLRRLIAYARLGHVGMNLSSSPSFDQINSMINNTCSQQRFHVFLDCFHTSWKSYEESLANGSSNRPRKRRE